MVEVVIADRFHVGPDGTEEFERLSPLGDERKHAGPGIVSAPADDRVVRAPLVDEPGEPAGIVVGGLDVGVVQEPETHRSRFYATGSN